MKIDDLVLLIKAGYTKADIEQLGISLGQEGSSMPADPAPEQPDPQPDPQPEAPAPKPDDDRMTKLETKLDYAINRLNYMAVNGSQQPPQQPQETVDDILASVVRGFKDEK